MSQEVDDFEADIKNFYCKLVSKEGVVNVGGRDAREEDSRGVNII